MRQLRGNAFWLRTEVVLLTFMSLFPLHLELVLAFFVLRCEFLARQTPFQPYSGIVIIFLRQKSTQKVSMESPKPKALHMAFVERDASDPFQSQHC